MLLLSSKMLLFFADNKKLAVMTYPRIPLPVFYLFSPLMHFFFLFFFSSSLFFLFLKEEEEEEEEEENLLFLSFSFFVDCSPGIASFAIAKLLIRHCSLCHGKAVH